MASVCMYVSILHYLLYSTLLCSAFKVTMIDFKYCAKPIQVPTAKVDHLHKSYRGAFFIIFSPPLGIILLLRSTEHLGTRSQPTMNRFIFM